MHVKKKPTLELRLRVLSAVDYAPGNSIQERIRQVATRTFSDDLSKCEYQFTHRTISTWLYRYKSKGITSMENKTRSDKNTHRKVAANELAEAIKEVLPKIRPSKQGHSIKICIYRMLLKGNYFQRTQLSATSFYRMVRDKNLLDSEACQKLRQSFAMQYANELWQADTMHGPTIQQSDCQWRKTFLIAFIDDASRVITHAEFFYRDNTGHLIDAFRTALYKRGKPQRLYFDNGSNYKSKEIMQACLRLNIHLSHAPIRDGAAKGKIERFFRGFRDRFLTMNSDFKTLDELNQKTWDWMENEYNSKYHTGIQMIPIDRFNLDLKRIQYISDDKYTAEVFYVEEERKVGLTNTFSINNHKYECPVDLREKKIQVRYDRSKHERFIVYFKEKRMGEASPLNLQHNAKGYRFYSNISSNTNQQENYHD